MLDLHAMELMDRKILKACHDGTSYTMEVSFQREVGHVQDILVLASEVQEAESYFRDMLGAKDSEPLEDRLIAAKCELIG
jgi:hypothetical protein